MLENVKNLVSHDKGKTFKVIMNILENELKYNVKFQIIDGKYFVPQHRERIIIVGFKDKNDFSFDDFKYPRYSPRLKDILHPEDGSEPSELPYTHGDLAQVHQKYVLSDHLWEYLRDYARRQRERGNGFGYGLVTGDDIARTLSARYFKDGSEILISRGDNQNPRKLTPRECCRLMGFDNKFIIPVSDTQAYKQFGNSVVVPVMQEIARIMTPYVVTKC
jgi:DNA (cytosine-5)-methyltransferase 1